jgi:hypothetical protein
MPIVDTAKACWIASGLTPEQAAALAAAHVTIADLEGATLGQTEPALSSVEGGTTVWLDPTAAGHGWVIDLTPFVNEEFIPFPSPLTPHSGSCKLPQAAPQMAIWICSRQSCTNWGMCWGLTISRQVVRRSRH